MPLRPSSPSDHMNSLLTADTEADQHYTQLASHLTNLASFMADRQDKLNRTKGQPAPDAESTLLTGTTPQARTPAPKAARGFVDRVEGNKAVIMLEGQGEVIVPVKNLPFKPYDGMHIIGAGGGFAPDPVSEVDTVRRAKAVLGKLQGKAKKGYLDRIEGNQGVVMIEGQGQVLVPVSELPSEAVEGSHLTFSGGEFQVDTKSESKTRKKVKDIQEKLLKKGKTKNGLSYEIE